MRTVANVGRLVVEVVRYGVASRRFSVVLLVLLGLVLLALALTAKATAPLIIYPFA